MLSSALALAVVAVGGGATWAATGGAITRVMPPPPPHPVPAPSPSDDGRGTTARQVDVYGPDGLPTAAVAVFAGQRLVVHLSEQAGSTGYAWSVAGGGGVLVKQGDKVNEAKGSRSMPGAPTDHAFTFRPGEPGTTRLVFTMRRAGDASVARTVSLPVTVGSPSPAPMPSPTPAPDLPTINLVGPQGLPSSAVVLKTGQRLLVHLSEQAGTSGFSWSASSVPGSLRLVDDKVVPGKGAIGAPGEHLFGFEAIKAVDGRLAFTLSRPGTGEVAQRVQVRIAGTAAGRTVDVHGPRGLPDGPVAVRTGDRLVVHLSQQTGTAFSWAVTAMPKNLTRVSDEVGAGPGVPGGAVDHTFTFLVNATGTGTIAFSLQGLPGSDPGDTLDVRVAARR